MLRRAFVSLRIRISEFPLREIQNSLSEENDNYKIPGTCYQTWVDNRFGRNHRKEIENFRSLNPNISWVLFNEIELHNYMRENWQHHPIYRIFLNSRFGPMKADIFRYCILFDRGGYYFDISKGCNIPIRAMHKENDSAVISFENNISKNDSYPESGNLLKHPDNLIIQWGFGFEKGHPFLAKVISRIVSESEKYENRVFPVPKEAILSFTGPRAFTYAVRSTINPTLAETLSQFGVDFNKSGSYALRGSYVRYFTKEHYTQASNQTILESAEDKVKNV